MELILEKLKKSPKLPQYLREMQDFLAQENQKRQEYYALMKENEKVEFINGEIIYQSPIKKKHGTTSDLLMRLVGVYVDLHDLGHTGHEKYVISLNRNDYEPDVCFWSQDKAQHFTEDQMHFPAPDFVAEVLSKSTEKRDRGIKFEDYALHSVQEYWIIDTNFRTIEQYLLNQDKFELKARFSNDDIIESKAITGFAIPAYSIFDKTENMKALQNLLEK